MRGDGVWRLTASLEALAERIGVHLICVPLARPAFSLERLRVRREGNVSCRVKKAGRGRVKERVMTPVECLARLAALMPPPRFPLLRLHGVSGPRHAWLRARVVPRPPVETATRACKSSGGDRTTTSPPPPPPPPPPLAEPRSVAHGDGRAAFVMPDLVATSTLTASGAAAAPNVLSLAHWARLEHGALYAPISRVDWATLLRRTFDTDLRCARCGGRLTVRAVVTDPVAIGDVLAELRRARDPPTAA